MPVGPASRGAGAEHLSGAGEGSSAPGIDISPDTPVAAIQLASAPSAREGTSFSPRAIQFTDLEPPSVFVPILNFLFPSRYLIQYGLNFPCFRLFCLFRLLRLFRLRHIRWTRAEEKFQ